MKRDSMGASAYWEKSVIFSEKRIFAVNEIRKKEVAANSGYEPQYVFDLARTYWRLMIERYSRGDGLEAVAGGFSDSLDAWEESERLGVGVGNKQEQRLRHDWSLNLHHYMDCFWLTGLALALKVPDEQWKRLLTLMGNEGKDALLDRVIATRQPGRKIGEALCFPKAYQGLLKVVDAPVGEQPGLLRDYLDSWFVNLENAGSPNVERYLRTPYWYTYGDENFEGGAYFGRWCIEAVAVVKAFGVDDRLCLEHPNYPGDLIRDNRSPRYPDIGPSSKSDADGIGANGVASPSRPRNWLSRLLLGSGKR